ncbi:MAG: hypothetical protein Q9204_003308 [Flavoplaca sp. TL-2023a]
MPATVQYAQTSAKDTCSRYYTIYNACLISNGYSETACADARIGYVYCSNYTLQAYAYCGCYFAEPDQIFNCANVELQINAVRDRDFDPAPSSTILSSALLNGPIAPSSATLSEIPMSVPTNVPVFSPRQSSSLVAASTTFITSTLVVTSCTDGAFNCPATTILSSSAVVSSTLACASGDCIVPPSSLPPQTGTTGFDEPLSTACPPGACDIPSYISDPTEYTLPDETPSPTGLPEPSSPVTTLSSTNIPIAVSGGTTSSSTSTTPPISVISPSSFTAGVPVSVNTTPSSQTPSSLGGVLLLSSATGQSTTTLVSTVPVTRTSTITSCPAAVTSCPAEFSSEVAYTTSTVQTVLSCNGGCDTGPTTLGECVVRTRVKVLTKGEL